MLCQTRLLELVQLRGIATHRINEYHANYHFSDHARLDLMMLTLYNVGGRVEVAPETRRCRQREDRQERDPDHWKDPCQLSQPLEYSALAVRHP